MTDLGYLLKEFGVVTPSGSSCACSLTECQTTSGCAHRGPKGEFCWFPTEFYPSAKSTMEDRLASIENKLANIAEAIRALGETKGQ
jgi:hypothetical protein